jgi:hypothetical protein
MKGKTAKGRKSIMAETPVDVGRILGLTLGDVVLMKAIVCKFQEATPTYNAVRERLSC